MAPGVGAKQPRPPPANCSNIRAACRCPPSSGFMIGSYSMVTEAGERFDIAIPGVLPRQPGRQADDQLRGEWRVANGEQGCGKHGLFPYSPFRPFTINPAVVAPHRRVRLVAPAPLAPGNHSADTALVAVGRVIGRVDAGRELSAHRVGLAFTLLMGLAGGGRGAKQYGGAVRRQAGCPARRLPRRAADPVLCGSGTRTHGSPVVLSFAGAAHIERQRRRLLRPAVRWPLFPAPAARRHDAGRSVQRLLPGDPDQGILRRRYRGCPRSRRTRYAALPNAFVYRERLVGDCSCNGRTSYGLANLDAARDPTLRPGDIIATKDGLLDLPRDALAARRRHRRFHPDRPLAHGSLSERLGRVAVVGGQ